MWLILTVIILYLLWEPLRSTSIAYSLVSVTVTNPVAAAFFRIVTTLGSEGFFLVMLAVVYWCVNKSLGFWGLVLMPAAIFVTSEIPKDIVRLPRPDVRGVTVPTYTFPSGHTSGAVSVWGYLAIRVQRRWFWLWTLVIVVMVGLSRTTLGYHYPGDVLGGLVTGTLFLIAFLWIEESVSEMGFAGRIPIVFLVPVAIGIPVLMSFIPAYYAPSLMGYVAGAGPGYLLQRSQVRFCTGGSWRQHVVRLAIGIGVLAVIMFGLDMVVDRADRILVFGQHALATFWITGLAPLVFVRFGYARGGSDG